MDPNEKLRLAAERKIRDLKQWRTEKVVGWKATSSISRAGNPTQMVKVVTEDHSFTFWVQMNPKHPEARELLAMYTALNGQKPETITYRKADFYAVRAFNREVA